MLTRRSIVDAHWLSRVFRLDGSTTDAQWEMAEIIDCYITWVYTGHGIYWSNLYNALIDGNVQQNKIDEMKKYIYDFLNSISSELDRETINNMNFYKKQPKELTGLAKFFKRVEENNNVQAG